MENEEMKEVFERITALETTQPILLNLLDSVQKLALGVENITVQNKQICDRLYNIENEKRAKDISVWGTIVSLIIGGFAALAFQNLMK